MTAPVRVVHFIERVDLREGGVVHAVLDLAGAQSDAGARVTLVTRDASDVPGAWSSGGPGVLEIDGGRAGLDRASGGRLASALEGGGVLHAHGVWSPLFWPVAASARRLGAPLVISGHGMLSGWALGKKRWKKRAYLAAGLGRILRGADAVHFACGVEAEQACSRMRFRRPEVIPLIVNDGLYAQLPGPGPAREAWPFLAGDRPTVLFLSRVFPGKGLELLIDASAELHRSGVDHRLVIAGPAEDGYRSRIEARIAVAGLGARASLLGMVRGVHKQSLLEMADVMALPSDHENFSVSLFESLACGTPVLASDMVQTAGELRRSGAGEIVTRDAGAIASALGRMLADREALAARGAAGRAWFFKELGAAGVAGRYLDLYRSLEV